MLDFSQAPEPIEHGSQQLIPDGTYAWARLEVEAYNAGSGQIEHPAKNTPGGRYILMHVTIVGGPYAGVKIKEYMTTAHPENKGVQGTMAAFKAILEASGVAGPDKLQGYRPPSYQAFNGLFAAIKVSVEKGSEYQNAKTGETMKGFDRNRVGLWISPIAAKTQKAWQELMQAVGPRPAGSPSAAVAPVAAAYGVQPTYQPAAPQQYQQPPQQQPAGDPQYQAHLASYGGAPHPQPPQQYQQPAPQPHFPPQQQPAAFPPQQQPAAGVFGSGPAAWPGAR